MIYTIKPDAAVLLLHSSAALERTGTPGDALLLLLLLLLYCVYLYVAPAKTNKKKTPKRNSATRVLTARAISNARVRRYRSLTPLYARRIMVISSPRTAWPATVSFHGPDRQCVGLLGRFGNVFCVFVPECTTWPGQDGRLKGII